MHYIIFLCQHL